MDDVSACLFCQGLEFELQVKQSESSNADTSELEEELEKYKEEIADLKKQLKTKVSARVSSAEDARNDSTFGACRR